MRFPHGEAYGNVYIAETETTFSTVEGGVQKVLRRVEIPLAMSDSDVLSTDSEMTKSNYLLVGGPCANAATAKVLGVSTAWPACAEGFQEGIGRIIVKEMGDKVSMIVAGYSALDKSSKKMAYISHKKKQPTQNDKLKTASSAP